ncbi:MAG: acyl-CoA dehydrogenase [Candidatus Saccharibacteria bacterium]
MSSSNFVYEIRDTKFALKEWLDLDKTFSYDAYKDYYSKDDVDSFLDVAFKICRDVIAPANADADEIGLKYDNGKVITPDSFKKVYQTVMEAELGPQVADREVEGHIPLVLNAPIIEMQTAASGSIVTYWALTQGTVALIQHKGSEFQKELFLPKLISGEWGGSMCLTEPGAGSDVGAVATKAFATDKPGIYKIKGQKIFITAGDHDCASNFVHLVLARTEGALPGTAGISLFIVPKYWVNEDGSLGEYNDVFTTGIEHKMGIKGSPTCSLAFGEEDKCYGYLIGDPPVDGKGKGMAQMFQMMNEERINTGLFSLGVMSQAYYSALAYTKERIQGTKTTDPKGPKVRIIEHEDIRRMLMLQKSVMEATRALLYKTFWYIDMSHDSSDPAEREYADDMFMINNPLCKAYTSDMARQMTVEAIQCYGGYGFIEEYPAAELNRDCHIYCIWEGTNYIQANDLTGRKMSMKGGAPFQKWMGEIKDFIDNKKAAGFEAEFKILADAYDEYQTILGMIGAWKADGKIQMVPTFATRILHATAMLYCGMLITDQALIAAKKLAELGDSHYDANFYKGKVASARFYVKNVVPQIYGVKKAMEIADITCLEIPEEAL